MIIFKKYGLSFLALFIYLLSNAQSDFSLLSKWDYTPSGNYERINKVIAASNGQLFAVGETSDPYSKTFYGLLLILNEDGTVHLRQRFGSSGQSSFNAVVQNFDGTFTLVGYSRANARSAKKGWVVQVDLDGKEIFNKVIRSAWKGDDELIDVATNGKGELLAVGSQDDMRSHDLWLVRIDNKEISDRQIGRGELGPVTGIVGGADGSFVLLGNVSKKNKKYYQDAWVKKIDQNGDDLWGGPRYLGGKGLQQGNDITKVAAGGYAIAGTIGPNGGGATDKWLVKLNNKGETVWTRTFGGAADDVASAVVELSEGGFALVGQTLSYLQRAKYSAADIILTDANGKELDSETYITGASGGHEIGLSVVEAYNGDLIATGCLIPEKSSQLSHVFLSAHSYKPFTAPKRSGRAKEEVYGDALSHALQVSNTTFVDADNNQSLDAGERGYFMLEVANQSDTKLEEVSGKISASSATAQIDVWETVQIGTLQPGQKKQIIVPVKATKSIPRGEYTFGIALESKGAILTSTTAKLSSNRPDPAKLVADGSFSPLKNPSPGETISLNVEILNTGGLASVPTEAYFRIPVGVQSLGSEKISIPALPPHSSLL